MLHFHPESGTNNQADASPSAPATPESETPSATLARPEEPSGAEGERPGHGEVGPPDPGADAAPRPEDSAEIPTARQVPAAAMPEQHPPASWSDRLAALLPPPPALPPRAPGGTSGGSSEIPLEERIVLAAAACFKTWLSCKSVRARDLMNEVPAFKTVYKSPNALGTLLGKGVAGHGLGLFRRGDAYQPTYANGWQLAQRLTSAQFERVARLLGFDGAEPLAAAIRNLPEAPA